MNRLKTFLRVYKWPIFAAIAYIAAAFIFTGWAYLPALWQFLRDPAWWAENTFSVIIFTIILSLVINISATRRAKVERAPYEGWQRIIIESDGSEAADDLYWEDVRRIMNSRSERWRLVKTFLSSRAWIHTPSLEVAEMRWLKIDEEARKIVIDFREMTAQDLDEENAKKLGINLAEKGEKQ